jgi:hypothetical protein
MRTKTIALAALLLTLTSLTGCSSWIFRLPQTPKLAPSTTTLQRAPVPSQIHKLMKRGI